MATVTGLTAVRMQQIADASVVSGSVSPLGNLILTTSGGAEIDAGAVMDPLAPGTVQQYYRGDKSWQTLDKTAVGLGNVDNTSDASKPFVGKGTSAERDSRYGVPSTAAEEAALANAKVVWYNTSTNALERYFGKTGTVGLTVTGIVGNSGWFNELSTAYKKTVLAAPTGYTTTDEASVTRSGAMVTLKGRFNRSTGQTNIFPVGAIPLGFRPQGVTVFTSAFVAGAVHIFQVNADGSVATPFNSITGDVMFLVTYPTDPTILPY